MRKTKDKRSPKPSPKSKNLLKSNRKNGVLSRRKKPELVRHRRLQIIEAAASLFVKNGFHGTTTKQIAKAAGFSVGTLYEYVRAKDDILFLVLDSIFEELENVMQEILARQSGPEEKLAQIIRQYFLQCDRWKDLTVLMYQETKSLSSMWRRSILENEKRVTDLFSGLLKKLVKIGYLPTIEDHSIRLIAHSIVVLAQMWAFRRWALKSHYTIEEYIDLQTKSIIGMVRAHSKASF